MDNIKPQIPAHGISNTGNWCDGSSSHLINCDCCDSEHSINMWIEVNSESNKVEICFYVNTWTPFIDGFFKRLKQALKILFTGIVKYQHDVLLTKQAAINFSNVIITEVEKISILQSKKDIE